MLHAQERAAEVDGDDPVEVLVVGVGEQLVDADARVVVGVVEAAVAVDDVPDEGLAVLRV